VSLAERVWAAVGCEQPEKAPSEYGMVDPDIMRDRYREKKRRNRQTANGR